MNETNLVEAAGETAAENEQKEAKEAKGEGAEGIEQKVTEETKGETGAEGKTLTPALSQGEREITGVLRAIEEALPELLRQSRARAVRQEHPAGEAFFRGNSEEVSDAEAEEVARKQLERSGLLRGQRVRVAD